MTPTRDEQLHYQVGRIAGIVETLPDRMDALERSMRSNQESTTKVVAEVTARVTSVERRQNYLAGLATSAGAVLGAAATFLTNKLLGSH